MSRRGAAPDLAIVLAAEESARRKGAATVERSRKLRRFYRRLAAGKVKPRKPYLSREERAELYKVTQRRRLETIAERNRQADTAIPVSWRDAEDLQEFLDEGYNWAEAKAAREMRHALTRSLVAAKCEDLAAWAEHLELADDAREYRVTAQKLRMARTEGHWGFDRITGRRFMRFRDRSGLVRLDPTESNRDTARQIRRLVPALLRLKAAGYVLYKAVFSMPNVPLGELAWGKREIFRMMARALEACPEVVGRFDAQEDPLAIDGQSWNVHVNTILVVDPKRCTPLPAEFFQQLEINLPGALGVLPASPKRDRTPPGCLSYAKLHYLWGANQVQLRKLEARDAEALAEEIKEVVKYAVKWIGKKHFDQESPRAVDAGRAADAPGSGRIARHGIPAANGNRSPGARAPHRGEGSPARHSDSLVESAPAALPGIARLHAASRQAPCFVDWPNPVAHEWFQAQRRTRRVRTYGVLFKLPKDELPPDPEKDGRLRVCGRVKVTPTSFYVEAARLRHLDLIHGHKSGAIFPGSTGRSPANQARAGPAGVQAVA